ncbi:MAG TPA: hypothetical protein VH540_03140 [Ktedonobacterales bacterium]|jgi:hypothetical protein
MFQVDRQVYSALWGLCGLLLAAGWVAYGMLGGDRIFLTVMVILSMVLFGGLGFLVRRRPLG